MAAFSLAELEKMYESVESISDMLNNFFEHPVAERVESLDVFEQNAKKNVFCVFVRNNEYVPDNFSILVNIPYIINENDSHIKSFQLIKGFGGRFEIKIVNYKTEQTVFGVSSINKGSGILSVKYNHKTDAHVLNDPKINSGTNVMILGLGICYIFKVKTIVLGDKATVQCDSNEKYPLRLTLFKKLSDQKGFYEKFGFKLSDQLNIPLKMVKNAKMKDLMGLFDQSWDDDSTIKEYITSLTSMNTIGEKNCNVFSNLLENISSVMHCGSANDRLQQLCEAITDINKNIEHQEKTLVYQDYIDLQNLSN